MSDKGARRREALVRAASALLAEQGPAAVTSRAVASRAGVPLSAVTYYFESRETLLRAAAEQVAATALAVATARATAGRADGVSLADTVARVWLAQDEPRPGDVRALLLAVLQVGAEPAVAPVVRYLHDDLADLAGGLLRRAGRRVEHLRTLLAAIDGVALAHLGARGALPVDPPTFWSDLVAEVEVLLEALAPAEHVPGAESSDQNRRADGSSRPDSAA